VVGPPDSQPSDLELRRAIAETIGRIAIVWTHLEAQCHTALWGLISTKNRVSELRPLTVGLPIERIWETTKILLEEKGAPAEIVSWFDNWRKRALELKRCRNDAIHSWWLATGDVSEPFKALDVMGRRTMAAIKEDVVAGGLPTLLSWVEDISRLSIEQLNWMQGPLQEFLRRINEPTTEGSPTDY
jgi:hypothetical protein